MLTFKQLVAELAREEVALSAEEMRKMTARFGENVTLMGHLQEDGSMYVPIDCIVEAAREVGAQTLTEAAESMNGEQFVSMLRAGEALVKKVVEARERKLRRMIRSFQNEPDAGKSHAQWRQIEKQVFGVEYND